MYEIYERNLDTTALEADSKILLTHEQRTKARFKTVAEDGEEVRIFLDHGKVLQVGECLHTKCGKTLRVDGAVELVAKASCSDWHSFARACYHLGNRHTKVQVGDLCLRMTPDHVLEEMLVGLGLSVVHEHAVFIPENGAYHSASSGSSPAASGHSHAHSHDSHDSH